MLMYRALRWKAQAEGRRTLSPVISCQGRTAKGGEMDNQNDATKPLSDDNKQPKLRRKEYEKVLRELQTELCSVQDWVKQTGQRIVVVFEGRDAAGKGGTIRAMTERVSPRTFRLVALPAPSDREKSQMYVQRYIAHFPAAGEIVIFDRQLVQSRRRRICHGLLHQGAAQTVP